MKTSHPLTAKPLLLLIGLNLVWCVQAQELKFVSAPPASGTFFSLQLTNQPPFPMNPWPELNVFSWGDVLVFDDRAVNYDALKEERALMKFLMSLSNESGAPSPGEGEGGEYDNPPVPGPAYHYTSGLWLSIEETNNLIYLTAHGTEANLYYQILSKSDLNNFRMDF